MESTTTRECPDCLGSGIRVAGTNLVTGQAIEQECWACAGKGVLREDGSAIIESKESEGSDVL